MKLFSALRRLALPVLAFSTMGAANPAEPETPKADKSGYTLFNPTPRELMRELSPDRPDKTESPHTVDAGHFQIEMDFANYSRNRSAGEQTWNFAPINFKAGLLNNVDLQLIFDNTLHSRTREGSSVVKRTGVGDSLVRLKVNLWGNDEGETAFALMPFVKFPTHTAGLGSPGVEGGLILPLAVKLPLEWEMGMMTEVDFLRNSGGGGYHAEFVNSITFSHSIVGKLSGFLEFFSAISTESGQDWVGTVDCGLTYLVTENLQLDCGVNIGVTRAADDYNPFAGLTWRF